VKLHRKKKPGGKFYGTFFVMVGKTKIGLQTKDPTLALQRAREVAAGKREFEPDTAGGVAGMAASALFPPTVHPWLPDPSPTDTPPEPPAETAPEAPRALLAAIPDVSGPSPPTGVTPDAYAGPGATSWTATVGAAATETAGTQSDKQEADDAADEPPEAFLDAELISQIVEEAAVGITELQIKAQEWALKRGLLVPGMRVRAAVVTPDAKGRAMGRKLWMRVFSRLMPDKLPIPDWVAAPAMILVMTLPVQLGPGASVVTKEEQEAEAAAAAVAVGPAS
jgi:hypothetical protein